MPNFPSVFPFWWIALTAGVTFVVSYVILWILNRRGHTLAPRAMLGLALLAGLSVLLWRAAGNVAMLNNDPIPPFSPNDFLCPIVTYVFLETAAAFHPLTDREHWGKARAWLTLVSFVVNVLVI